MTLPLLRLLLAARCKPVLLLAAILMFHKGFTQQENRPFYDEIMAFKKQDNLHPPPSNPILFVGSSSIRKWTNLQEAFPGYPVLNRGFGGSSIPDVIRYAPDIIFPYRPKQIVFYCGENDIAGGTVDAQEVSKRFRSFFTLVRKRLPDVSMVFISIKPSPSREKYLAVVKQANQMIRNFLWQQRNVLYVDVYSRMLDSNGKTMPALFTEDMLHMNAEGYRIWQETLKAYLLKN